MAGSRTVTFKSALHGLATRVGLDPDVNLNNDEARELTEYLNTAMELAWEYYPWPGQSVVAQFTASAQLIPLASNGIDEVFGVTEQNPDLVKNPVPVPYKFRGDNLILTDDYETADVWLEYRKAEPVFSSVAHDNAATYALGDLVYDATTGESYKSLQAANTGNAVTDGAWWEKVDFPAILRQAVVEGAHTLAKSEEGQESSAAVAFARMTEFLDLKVMGLDGMQGQSRGFDVLVREGV